MVPITEAINSGLWLYCEYEGYNEIIKFRIKINSFRKLNLSEIDNPDKIEMLDSDANLMLMEVDVVNLVKETKNSDKLVGNLILTDQDEFNFPIFSDVHLCWGSNFAKKSRLNRFFSEQLIPKIKTKGSLIFQLPDDDDAVYTIGVKNNGIVQEV
ncbi:hypothetical protein LG651_09445 [Tamlana sp. 62-3]|uniref:Uncharacterized protein n=1 Tax=Neotamlana sargassicola TaxID=2883125 RepID=A0A9X1L752_9FLAO|nr:hypothetical protein [Tamlana sargassicola]MCB4808476.1 hypothetical protein [Tamlana sargassicola]